MSDHPKRKDVDQGIDAKEDVDNSNKRKGSIKTYILEALGSFCHNGQALLSLVQKEAQDYSTDEFVTSKVAQLGSLIGYYSDLFTQCDVLTRESLEKLLQANFRYPEIQESYDEILEFEDEFTGFLDEIDSKLQINSPSDVLSVEDEGPIDVPLTDVIEDRQTTLRTELAGKSLVMAEIEAANGRIIVLSFGVKEGAHKWIDETKCPYKLYLDPDREIYCKVGLRRSVSKTWGVKNLTYYGEKVRAGRPLPKAFSGVEDDPNQMGGDFIIDPSGKLIFSYRSSFPADRPDVDTLINVLKEKSESRASI